MQLYFSAALHYEFTLVRDTGDQCAAIDDESVHECSRLLLWLTTRQCEISLFRYLQNSANQLGTMSSTDLERIILHLLRSIGALSLHSDLDKCAKELYPVRLKNISVGERFVANV